MKKFFLSAFVILSFAFYALNQRVNSVDSVYVASNNKEPILSIPPSVTTPPSPQYRAYSGDEEDDYGSFFRRAPKTVNPPKSTATIPAPATTPSTSVINSGIYKDGAYTGNVADAYYGNVQVKAVISNGKITDVIFLDYPHDRNTSVKINTQAMPYLKSEAIAAQSASVDVVSGASATSGAFNESLASALAQAKI